MHLINEQIYPNSGYGVSMAHFASTKEFRNHERTLGPAPKRCHVRTLRGGEIASDPMAVKAFIIEGREVRPLYNSDWGARPVMINTDRIGGSAWELEDGTTLCIGAFDLIEALIDLPSLGYDVVGFNS